jgi:ribosomal protein S18 acetylase RimI-like enzyme
MNRFEFIAANPIANKEELIELNVEYLSWVFEGIEDIFSVPKDQIVGMPARDYVPSVIDKVCGDPPPKGIFYLVKVDGKLAGMGGLRRLSKDVAEIKRIYFRPDFRGMKLGEIMLKRLLDDAVSFRYRSLYLDTGPFMASAQRLYESNGFLDCDAYDGAEVPIEFHSRWRFMTRALPGDF